MRYACDHGEGNSPSVYKIIYHSQIETAGGPDRIASHVKDILTWSRAWNPQHGITGALMLNEENFAQVLEGPKHAVKALFGHIVCDPRHKNVEMLQCDMFQTRDFSSWSMAFAGSVDGPDINLVSQWGNGGASLFGSADSVMSLLRWLLLEERGMKVIRGGLRRD